MAPTPTETKQYLLEANPTSTVDPAKIFKLVTTSLPELKPNQVLIQLRYISNDPAQRGWISAQRSPDRLYVPPVKIGEVMRARGICTVLSSTSDKFKAGQTVAATCGWTEYAVLDAGEVTPLAEVSGLGPTHFLGALGMTGITAMYGLDVVDTNANDKVLVVSGAAGATGSMVVQIAKHIIGVSKVIGLAGTDAKCRWVEKLGADICINYKSEDWKNQLREATPGPHYTDVYFDNVGGETLDLMLSRMGRGGRVAQCGSVSTYNSGADAYAIRNVFEIISMRIRLQGFIVMDAAPKYGEYVGRLVKGYEQGKLKIGDENETIVKTDFVDIPKTWLKLFSGENTGKLVTALN